MNKSKEEILNKNGVPCTKYTADILSAMEEYASQFTAGNAALRSDLPEEDKWYFCVCDDVYKEVLWHHGNNFWMNQQEQKVDYKNIKWLDYEKY